MRNGGEALILRLFRGRAPGDRASDVFDLLAGAFLEAARAMRGLSSYAAGMRLDEDGVRFVLVSTWDTVAELSRQTGGAIDRPLLGLPAWIDEEGVDHYELVGDPVPIHVAPPEAVVRVASMAIEPGREEEFYQVVRDELARVTTTGRLLAYHLGRRIEAARHVAAAVSVWRSADALGELVRPETGEPLWGARIGPLLQEFGVEHYDAVRVDVTT